jgi:tetrahydromethanopterin S-methyltransferase subunit A
LKRIILCGNDVKGHRAGQALLALHKNGIDMQGKIIGAIGPYPILEAKLEHVMAFQTQITITDLIGVTDIEKIFSVT